MEHDFGLTEGGVLLACSSCPSGRTTTVMTSSFPSQGLSAPPDADAVLVEYTGNKQQNQRFRSKVNAAIHYKFSALHPQLWVHKDDAALIVARGDFVEKEYVPPTPEEDAPVILAARTPVMANATAGGPGAGPLTLAPPPPPAEAPEPTTPVETLAPPQEPARTAEPVQVLAAPEPPAADPDAQPAPPEPDAAPQVSPEAMALARQYNRTALDQMARDLGIGEPETIGTKGELATGILTMQGMKAAMTAPAAPTGPARPA